MPGPRPIPSLPLAAGFTTIELITVIVMLGILVVVALPRMSNTQAFSERAFHDQLRSLVDYTRKSAVAARRYTCIILSPGTAGAGRAEVFIDATLLPEATSGSVDCTTTHLTLSSGTCAAGTLCAPRDVTLTTATGAPVTIVFSPLGQPETTARVPLAGRQVFTIGTTSLAVEPVTGLAH